MEEDRNERAALERWSREGLVAVCHDRSIPPDQVQRWVSQMKFVDVFAMALALSHVRTRSLEFYRADGTLIPMEPGHG